MTARLAHFRGPGIGLHIADFSDYVSLLNAFKVKAHHKIRFIMVID